MYILRLLPQRVAEWATQRAAPVSRNMPKVASVNHDGCRNSRGGRIRGLARSRPTSARNRAIRARYALKLAGNWKRMGQPDCRPVESNGVRCSGQAGSDGQEVR